MCTYEIMQLKFDMQVESMVRLLFRWIKTYPTIDYIPDAQSIANAGVLCSERNKISCRETQFPSRGQDCHRNPN